jgi:N-methylhydantoinase A
MIAYGGNGAVHAWAIAEELGVRRVIVPKAAPVFSALGLLVADYRVDVQRSHVQPLSAVDPEHLQKLIDELVAEARAELEPAGLGDESIAVQPYVQMAYGGQNFDMSIEPPHSPLTATSLLDLAGAFHDAHEADRGFAFRNQQPIVRGVRALVQGRTPKPPSLGATGAEGLDAARRGRREVFLGDGFVDAQVIDGDVLAAGAVVAGPALIEERFTVVVVPPGWTATLGDHAAYELVRD